MSAARSNTAAVEGEEEEKVFSRDSERLSPGTLGGSR